MKQVYHRYEKWEDFLDGMWRIVPADQERSLLKAAIEFTGNAELYGSYMQKVIDQWPVACEHNLSNSSMNRLAWVGHAATSLAIKCPEYITRQAWSHLNQQQRDEANEKASLAVDMWVFRYRSLGQYTFDFWGAA